MSNCASSSTNAASAAADAAAAAAAAAERYLEVRRLAVEAEIDRQSRLAEQKRAQEFQESIKAEVAKLPSNPPTGAQWNRCSGWEGGAKRKRTTRTKKMKRRYARKSHRKSKRVMKR